VTYAFPGVGKAALLDKKNTAILPTVLKAITKSSTILHRVKLPLAIRYNDAKMIQQVTSQAFKKSTIALSLLRLIACEVT